MTENEIGTIIVRPLPCIATLDRVCSKRSMKSSWRMNFRSS